MKTEEQIKREIKAIKKATVQVLREGKDLNHTLRAVELGARADALFWVLDAPRREGLSDDTVQRVLNKQAVGRTKKA
jgi:hypothetical protein